MSCFEFASVLRGHLPCGNSEAKFSIKKGSQPTTDTATDGKNVRSEQWKFQLRIRVFHRERRDHLFKGFMGWKVVYMRTRALLQIEVLRKDCLLKYFSEWKDVCPSTIDPVQIDVGMLAENSFLYRLSVVALIALALLIFLLLRSPAQPQVDSYDIIVEIESLDNVLSNKNIQVKESVVSSFSIDRAQDLSIIGILGRLAEDHTWLLNKLLNANLASRALDTPTLNMFYDSLSRQLVLDVAPATISESIEAISNPQYLKRVHDAEVFLLDWVCHLSHMVIFVTSDFSWLEQIAFLKYHQMASQAEAFVVLHNIQSSDRLDEFRSDYGEIGIVPNTMDGVHLAVQTKNLFNHDGLADDSKLNRHSLARLRRLISPSHKVMVSESMAIVAKKLLSPFVQVDDSNDIVSSSNFNVSFHRSPQGCNFEIEYDKRIVNLRSDNVARMTDFNMYELAAEEENGEGTRELVFELEALGATITDVSIVNSSSRYLLHVRGSSRGGAHSDSRDIEIPVDRSWDIVLQEGGAAFKVVDGIITVVFQKETELSDPKVVEKDKERDVFGGMPFVAVAVAMAVATGSTAFRYRNTRGPDGHG